MDVGSSMACCLPPVLTIHLICPHHHILGPVKPWLYYGKPVSSLIDFNNIHFATTLLQLFSIIVIFVFLSSSTIAWYAFICSSIRCSSLGLIPFSSFSSHCLESGDNSMNPSSAVNTSDDSSLPRPPSCSIAYSRLFAEMAPSRISNATFSNISLFVRENHMFGFGFGFRFGFGLPSPATTATASPSFPFKADGLIPTPLPSSFSRLTTSSLVNGITLLTSLPVPTMSSSDILFATSNGPTNTWSRSLDFPCRSSSTSPTANNNSPTSHSPRIRFLATALAATFAIFLWCTYRSACDHSALSHD
mmetsp:Transcript_14824/g.25705  ORF Transcript_14824/g.25705 Transcript_14824/m.25705 type:complete len:304 (+) Transcript_14824:562-1473(+)